MDKKINAPSLADAVSEEMKAQPNNFHDTLNHGLGVVKNCMKEGDDTTTTNFHTVKGDIDALVTKDDMHEISSAISTIMEKRIGATLSWSTTKKKKSRPVAAAMPVSAASPYNIAQPPEVGCITLFAPMLEPPVAVVHIAAASPTITAHIPRPTGVSGSNIPDQELLRRPTFISDDYDETVEKLWYAWYKEGINLIVQDRKVSEKWRTEWSVKDNKKFSCLKCIVEYIQVSFEGKSSGIGNC
jgi:hypothetical protein